MKDESEIFWVQSTFGSNRYSAPRAGNVFLRQIFYKKKSLMDVCQIVDIESTNEPGKSTVRSLETGALADIDIRKEFISPLVIPHLLGFSSFGEGLEQFWFNEDIVLRDVSFSGPYCRTSDVEYTFSISGYEVDDFRTGETQLKAETAYFEEGNAAVKFALEFMHEFQNLYSDLIPDKSLDLSLYIDYWIEKQNKDRVYIDELLKKKK
jgi:hypothetical protein